MDSESGKKVKSRVITVSREFASGGRELGKRLADKLGFAYYDTEIVSEIVKQTELDANYVATITESGITSFNYHFAGSFGFYYDRTAVSVLNAQHCIIREVAAKGDCVIVGRGADVILDDFSPYKIFVFAPSDYKIARCRARDAQGNDLSDKELLKRFKKIDSDRAKMHQMLASTSWGERSAYNVLVNTGGIEIKKIIPSLSELSLAWFDSASELASK